MRSFAWLFIFVCVSLQFVSVLKSFVASPVPNRVDSNKCIELHWLSLWRGDFPAMRQVSLLYRS